MGRKEERKERRKKKKNSQATYADRSYGYAQGIA